MCFESKINKNSTIFAKLLFNFTLAFAYGVAGDAYMNLFENWDKAIVGFIEEFNESGDDCDIKISEYVEEYVDESKREWVLKVPKDVEENFFLALKCFRASMDLYNALDDDEATEPKTSVIGRFGNALNCTASLYIRKSTSMINR